MNKKKYISPALLAVSIGGEDAVAVDLPIGSKFEDGDDGMEILTKEEMEEEAGGTSPSPTNLWDNAW